MTWLSRWDKANQRWADQARTQPDRPSDGTTQALVWFTASLCAGQIAVQGGRLVFGDGILVWLLLAVTLGIVAVTGGLLLRRHRADGRKADPEI
jgi:hypothetical protein